MIVICAYGNNFIVENLNYIKKYNKNKKILIINNKMSVDVNSIKNKFSDLKISILDQKDNLRELGSWWAAYEEFPNEPWYCFIHDSMFIKQDVSQHVPKEGAFVFSSKKGWNGNHHMKADISKKFYNIVGDPTSRINLIFGCMFICNNSVMGCLKNKGITKIKAMTRSEAMSSERLLGLAFLRLGIPLIIYTNKIPAGKLGEKAASQKNPVKTENDLFVKIRSGR